MSNIVINPYVYLTDAPESFADSNAVSKALATGTSQAIYFVDTANTFNFVEDEAYNIFLGKSRLEF